jgi:hypothetical protein
VHGAVGGWTRLQIVRRGDVYTVSAGPVGGSVGQPMVASEPVTVVLRGPVYVGIGVCAHDADGLATVTFRRVKVERAGE